MFTFRRFSGLIVLVMILILAFPGENALASATRAANQTNGATSALMKGTPPCRQAQLMGPECQIEQAALKCPRTANAGWRCACDPAPRSPGVSASNASRTNTDGSVTGRAKRGGLIAK